MPTLNEARLTFLSLDRSPHTTYQYTLVLGRLVAAIGPERDVALIRYEDLADYLAGLKRKGLKPSTREGYLAVIRSFFSWCVRRGYLDKSPTKDLRVRLPRDQLHQPRAVPPEELRRMIEYARVTGQRRNYAIMLFLADTGARVGGLVSMTISKLDLGDLCALIIEKGNKPHMALFSETTADALRDWLQWRPRVGHDYVWTGQGPDYAPLKRGAVAAVVRRLARRTGASRAWGPHSIRHAVGHAYAKAGIPVTVTQQKLGHSTPLITMQSYYPDDVEYLRQVSREHPLAPLQEDPARPMLRLVKGSKKKTSS